MFAPVWERVVRGRYASAPATISGYSCYAVRDETYPGLIAQAEGTVHGVVYFDVDAIDLAVLDAFEGCDYRRDFTVAKLDSGEAVGVDIYVYLPIERLLTQAWEPKAFQMTQFLKTYCGEK